MKSVEVLKKALVFIFSMLFFLHSNIFGQECDRTFLHLGVDRGLSANHVKALVRDNRGFLWVGTTNGLNRYDGSSVRTYDCFDTSNGRGNNNIGALYLDNNNDIWIGTDRGVYKYKSSDDRIEYVGV